MPSSESGNNNSYDLIVIGSGPAGQKAAICAAKLRKRVAVIERKRTIGGVCVHTGTIPSKTFREAILYLSGLRQRTFYGRGYALKENICMQDLVFRADAVMAREIEVIKSQLRRNRVTVFEGNARFIDAHTMEVVSDDGFTTLRGDNFVIACGTRPAHDADIPIDGKRIFDSDQVHELEELPRELIVVGAGIIGLEYASMFAALGVKVTLLDQRPTILDFADREIVESLCFQLRQLGTVFRLGEKVVAVGFNPERDRVFAKLESGKTIHGAALLYSVGRKANSDQLNLESIGLTPGDRGKLTVDDNFRTAIPHIYAAGDVIGFPALASTSMEQGRLASCHIFGISGTVAPNLIPYGVYTIPEISMVGATEQELTRDRVPYETGIARYAELAKGQMLGDDQGFLKLIFDPATLKLLGVHIIGDRATEIVHIGQAVLSLGGTIEYFRDTVFNYPTLAEAFKVAALDGLNKL
ncbi:MAG: Si-specific NAD(P)(+) transhydrogenase [Candidatus Korobacteraceae bacterium]